MQKLHNFKRLIVESGPWMDVSDIPNHFPDQCIDIELRMGSDLSPDHNSISGHECLTGYPCRRILSEAGVENGIGYLITDLIRMSFTHRFTGKGHATTSFHY